MVTPIHTVDLKCYFAVEPIYLRPDDLSFHYGFAANVSITFRALATSKVTVRPTARVQTEMEHRVT